MKKYLLAFLFFPLVTININNKDSTQVNSSVKAEASGGNTKVETNIQTNVNQSETTVKTNQPGEVRIEVKNGETKIETSKGITPTIIIRGTVAPTVQEIISESEKPQTKIETQNILKDIFSPVRNIFRAFFDLFRSKKYILDK